MACLQFNCDEVVSLIQKLCENIGAMDLQHDKASVTWIGTFLQMRVKELEDKVAELWTGHVGLGLHLCSQARGAGEGQCGLRGHLSDPWLQRGGRSRVPERERNVLEVAWSGSGWWTLSQRTLPPTPETR